MCTMLRTYGCMYVCMYKNIEIGTKKEHRVRSSKSTKTKKAVFTKKRDEEKNVNVLIKLDIKILPYSIM